MECNKYDYDYDPRLPEGTGDSDGKHVWIDSD
jgi:hypothetical protein